MESTSPPTRTGASATKIASITRPFRRVNRLRPPRGSWTPPKNAQPAKSSQSNRTSASGLKSHRVARLWVETTGSRNCSAANAPPVKCGTMTSNSAKSSARAVQLGKRTSRPAKKLTSRKNAERPRRESTLWRPPRAASAKTDSSGIALMRCVLISMRVLKSSSYNA
jgi:hypothetical protein